jgi:hypothetical protein
MERDDEEDRPGNIHWTGEEHLNRVTRDCGVMRYRPGFYQMVEDNDEGRFVKYHNYCAAIRTKVSSIRHSDRLLNALVALARASDRETITRLQTEFPPLASDLETAFERSRDSWEPYKEMILRASEDIS